MLDASYTIPTKSETDYRQTSCTTNIMFPSIICDENNLACFMKHVVKFMKRFKKRFSI